MAPQISRRSFLKFSSLAFGASAFYPAPLRAVPPFLDQPFPVAIGRVAVPGIYIHKEPTFDSQRMGLRRRDELLSLLQEVRSPSGPSHNPLWYRLEEGFAHSGRIQRIEALPKNRVLYNIPAHGQYGAITVPYVRALRRSRSGAWQPLYRLYYGSVHWMVGVEPGPDGAPWYALRDTFPGVTYHIPAETLHPIPLRELGTISPEVPPEEKRILVSLKEQTLTAFEGDRVALHTTVSTGIHTEGLGEDEIPTDTPTGNFHIQLKMPSRHMGDGLLTSDPNAYELPGVPWTMVFHETGVALHGTYWHDNFGTPMSHGCVNLRSVDAKWLFRWTDPPYTPSDWYVAGYGTLVQIV